MFLTSVSEFATSGKLSKTKLQASCSRITQILGGNYFNECDLNSISTVAPFIDKANPSFKWPNKVWIAENPFPWERQTSTVRALLALSLIQISDMDPIHRLLQRYNKSIPRLLS